MKYSKRISLIFLSLLITSVGIPTSAMTRPSVTTLRESIRAEELFVREPRMMREERQRTDTEILVRRKGSSIVERLRVPTGIHIEEALSLYTGREDILYAEPNYIAYAQYVPNDPYYNPYQWNFDNATNGGIHMEDAWNVSSGSGVIVAVIDTGVAYEDYGIYRRAPDLANTAFVSGYDFVNNDTHPNDDQGHGTHVAGTLAGSTNNNSGVAGIAYNARIMPVKVLNRQGSGTYADIASGIRYAADNGAQVINLSLGGSSSSQTMKDAVQYAYNKGVTIIAAAGNNGTNGILYPAAYDEYVIAVGATRFDETRASYSNYGTSLDIVAPGGDTSVDQNGDGYGDGILQQTFGSNVRSFGYYFYQGTSMASPHVAGVAALVIANGNATTPSMVREALESTADDLGVSGKDAIYGAGLLNAKNALAYIAGGGTGTPPPVDAPPTIIWLTPSADSAVSGTISLSVNATDDLGIVQVDFYVNDVLAGTDVTNPYTYDWDTTSVTNGTSTVSATAKDTAGQTASASVSVFVQNTTPLPPPPPSGEITVFSDSFEVSTWNGLWTEGSQNDWFRSSQRATDGNVSAEVDGRARDAVLMSTPINLEGRTNVTITFDWLIESTLDTGEYVAMDISVDNGSSWQEKARLRGNFDAEDVWHHPSIQVTNISQLRIRFRATMSNSSEDANVDNVKVVAF